MAEMSPYQVLGISEEASFEEIQSARARLLASLGADEQQQERVEQAYDAILMQRLRLRKEGKIAVPDRIRYAEQRAAHPEPELSLPRPAAQNPPGSAAGWIPPLPPMPSGLRRCWVGWGLGYPGSR